MHCYYLEYSDYYYLYCYTHNVSVDMSFGLLQVFHVELGSQHRTSNLFTQVDRSTSIYHDRVQVLSYSKYSF